jgi:small subunit ribosomal protein S1
MSIEYKKATISNYKVFIKYNKYLNRQFFYEDRKTELKYIYNETNINMVNKYKLIQGIITSIVDKAVLVDIDFKSEGIIYLNEFIDKSKINIGDKIDVLVEKKEYQGQILLSYRKANILKAWERAKKAYTTGERIKGQIIGQTKGGMIVKILDYIEAFMPGSQIEKTPISNFEIYFNRSKNKTMDFKIIKINNRLKNIVVSHKVIIEANIIIKKKKILSKFKIGQVIKAKIKNLTVYGVYCYLGGIDGLLHYTEISWKRRNKPTDLFNLYDEITVVILDLNEKKNNVLLGIKQLLHHPWDELKDKIHMGDKVDGVVTSLTEYCAFIELINHPGVEAILHVSEIYWSSNLRSAKKILKRGDLVECIILTLNITERKMSLGMKQLTYDPWINVYKKYFVGSKHTGKIINFTIYGVFIQLEKGVDGMIHQTYFTKYTSNYFKIGNLIDVIILEVYFYYRRLILLKTPYLDSMAMESYTL